MRAALAVAMLALAVPTGALAQAQGSASKPYDFAPSADGPPPTAARPYGATYIPGVGFRYLAPGGPRVYGYRAYRTPRGYRTARGYRLCRGEWVGDFCMRR